jgi:hypothetical protein
LLKFGRCTRDRLGPPNTWCSICPVQATSFPIGMVKPDCVGANGTIFFQIWPSFKEQPCSPQWAEFASNLAHAPGMAWGA